MVTIQDIAKEYNITFYKAKSLISQIVTLNNSSHTYKFSEEIMREVGVLLGIKEKEEIHNNFNEVKDVFVKYEIHKTENESYYELHTKIDKDAIPTIEIMHESELLKFLIKK